MLSKLFEVKTYFKIVGDFEPGKVTALLNIIPVKQWKKGDIRHKLKDKVGVYDFSMWETGLVETVNEYCVDKQMTETIAELKTKIDVLKKIKERYDVKFFLEVVPKFYSLRDKPCLSPGREVMEFCYLTETEIDYDYYFYFDDLSENKE